MTIEEQVFVKIFGWNSVSFDDVFHYYFSQAVDNGDKRAGKDKITIPEMLIEASEVPGLNCFNDFLTFGDFCCVDQDFRVLYVNLLNGCIVVETKVAENLRFMMAQINSVVFHFSFYRLVVYPLNLQNAHGCLFVFVVHFHQLII